MSKPQIITDQVKNYYGKVLKATSDLKTSACCTTDSMPIHLRPILKNIHPEILDRFYGCGSPLPLALEGATVVDLGCGTGRDVYLASKLVGENGKVIGVDMTTEQISLAKKHQQFQAEAFGFQKSNVEFIQSYIEDLSAIPSESVDVVISNCVINLSPNKPQVFKEIFRILKPGGEIFFSDVFADRRIPKNLQENEELYGECLSGAMYTEDFRRLVEKLGCLDSRMVNSRQISVDNPELQKLLGNISFYSMTMRVFKLDTLEDVCEDYGQVATYLGTIPNNEHHFELDDHHFFETGKPMLVCGNTASMLCETRFAPHFKIVGNRNTHFGAFDCAPAQSFDTPEAPGGSCC